MQSGGQVGPGGWVQIPDREWMGIWGAGWESGGDLEVGCRVGQEGPGNWGGGWGSGRDKVIGCGVQMGVRRGWRHWVRGGVRRGPGGWVQIPDQERMGNWVRGGGQEGTWRLGADSGSVGVGEMRYGVGVQEGMGRWGVGCGPGGDGAFGDGGSKPLPGRAALWPPSREGGGFGVAKSQRVQRWGAAALPTCRGPAESGVRGRRRDRRAQAGEDGLAREGAAPPRQPGSGGALLPQVLTAPDRDASCRKPKLRQNLEQTISLVCGNS